MSYSKTISKLFSLHTILKTELGISNCFKLSEKLGNPHLSYPTVHVAGTNGKGSVCGKVAAALQAEGFRVGLYTSPHISCFRERIRINGRMISEEQVVAGIEKILSFSDIEKIPTTFFEVTTLLALKHFAENRVDYGVIETGLGGRLDATNIIRPLVSVVTSISHDHTHLLGTTLESIAREKGGIIKDKAPVVFGPNVPLSFLTEILEKKKSPYKQIEGSFSTGEDENCAIAKAVMQTLKISEECIHKGLSFHMPCRYEVIKRPSNFVVLDVAHNPMGFSQLVTRLSTDFPGIPVRAVLALSKFKDISGCFHQLIKLPIASLHFVEAQNGRSYPADHLKEYAKLLGIDQQKVFSDLPLIETLEKALDLSSQKKELLVICGSFFIMAEARRLLGYVEPTDPFDMNEKV